MSVQMCTKKLRTTLHLSDARFQVYRDVQRRLRLQVPLIRTTLDYLWVLQSSAKNSTLKKNTKMKEKVQQCTLTHSDSSHDREALFFCLISQLNFHSGQ